MDNEVIQELKKERDAARNEVGGLKVRLSQAETDRNTAMDRANSLLGDNEALRREMADLKNSPIPYHFHTTIPAKEVTYLTSRARQAGFEDLSAFIGDHLEGWVAYMHFQDERLTYLKEDPSLG